VLAAVTASSTSSRCLTGSCRSSPGTVSPRSCNRCTQRRTHRGDHSDNWSRRLGTERADQAWRCHDLHRAGTAVILGFDWPVVPFDPWPISTAAQLRRPWNRPDPRRVARGYRADPSVWAADPMSVRAEELATLPIELSTVEAA
jgi:predicted amidohydrolase YtcJ